MQAYTALTEMLNHADSFGEEQVIRDVAKRSGVMWTCVNNRCGLDTIGEGDTCEHCGYPAPEQGLRPGEWRCMCRASNWDRICRVCYRENPRFRSAQLYT